MAPAARAKRNYETHAAKRKREMESLERALGFMDDVSEKIDKLTEKMQRVESRFETTVAKVNEATRKMTRMQIGVDLKIKAMTKMIVENGNTNTFIDRSERPDFISTYGAGAGAAFDRELEGADVAMTPWSSSLTPESTHGVSMVTKGQDQGPPTTMIEGHGVQLDRESMFNITITIRPSTDTSTTHKSQNPLSPRTNIDSEQLALAALNFAVPVTACPTLELFMSNMIDDANECEDVVRHQEQAQGRQMLGFDKQFGELKIMMLIFEDRRMVGDTMLPLILSPGEPGAGEIYADWYNANVLPSLKYSKAFDVEAVYECDQDQKNQG